MIYDLCSRKGNTSSPAQVKLRLDSLEIMTGSFTTSSFEQAPCKYYATAVRWAITCGFKPLNMKYLGNNLANTKIKSTFAPRFLIIRKQLTLNFKRLWL